MSATTMPSNHSHFKHFNKFDFVEAFIALAKSQEEKEIKKKEAVIIADAIEGTQEVLFEHLVTKEYFKETLKHDLEKLEYKLTIKLTVITATLLTLLPLITEFLKKLF